MGAGEWKRGTFRQVAIAALVAAVLLVAGFYLPAGSLRVFGPSPSALAAARDVELDRLLAEGLAHYRAERYPESIGSLGRALERAESSESTSELAAEIRRQLGLAHGAAGARWLEAGELRRAEENFEKGLEHSDNYYSRFGLGFLYFQRMDNAKSQEQLAAALAHEPDFAGSHKLLALLAYRRGDTATAIAKLERARELDAADPEVPALLGNWKVERELTTSYVSKTIDRFQLRYDPEIPDRVRLRVVEELRRARRELGEALGFWPPDSTVVVLHLEERFHRATGAFHWVGGLYDGQLKLPVPAELDATKRRRLRKTVRHEYAHVLVRHLAPACPLWLNEGLAQKLERDGAIDPQEFREPLLEGYAKRPIALADIPQRLWEVDDVDLARHSYRMGFAFVEFLSRRLGAFRLRLLLGSLRRERSVSAAFEVTYGQPLSELEREWWKSVEGR